MNRSELINLLKTNKFWAKKSLGQNFLVDNEALNKIVEAAEIKPDDFVIEIGPGLGVLTDELNGKAKKIIAIEKDQELAEYIKDKKFEKLTILNQDVLTTNIPELVGDQKYKVVANIPYYITSKIIRLFLEQEEKPELMVLLVQKEVAERICAEPGDMSVLAISVQYYARPEIIDIVPANSFFPAPKVDSAIIRITRIEQSIASSKNEKEFFRLVNIGFASKRKTLSNNISAGYRIDKKKAADIIRSVGFNENVRAQELSVEDWKKLLQCINE